LWILIVKLLSRGGGSSRGCGVRVSGVTESGSVATIVPRLTQSEVTITPSI
jgi:hypothetical protein